MRTMEVVKPSSDVAPDNELFKDLWALLENGHPHLLCTARPLKQSRGERGSLTDDIENAYQNRSHNRSRHRRVTLRSDDSSNDTLRFYPIGHEILDGCHVYEVQGEEDKATYLVVPNDLDTGVVHLLTFGMDDFLQRRTVETVDVTERFL